jgi:hypothetical protein
MTAATIGSPVCNPALRRQCIIGWFFKRKTFRLILGTSQQTRQDFTLQAGTVAQPVEVTVAADGLYGVGGRCAALDAGSRRRELEFPFANFAVIDTAFRGRKFALGRG